MNHEFRAGIGCASLPKRTDTLFPKNYCQVGPFFGGGGVLRFLHWYISGISRFGILEVLTMTCVFLKTCHCANRIHTGTRVGTF